MWIEDVLKDIPPWAWIEMRRSFVRCVEGEHTIIAEVPDDIRPMFVKRRMLENKEHLAEGRNIKLEGGVELPHLAWYRDQAKTLSALISISLRHAGIVLDDDAEYVIGQDWKILKRPEPRVVPADSRMTELFGKVQILSAGSAANRSNQVRRSRVRLGQK